MTADGDDGSAVLSQCSCQKHHGWARHMQPPPGVAEQLLEAAEAETYVRLNKNVWDLFQGSFQAIPLKEHGYSIHCVPVNSTKLSLKSINCYLQDTCAGLGQTERKASGVERFRGQQSRPGNNSHR